MQVLYNYILGIKRIYKIAIVLSFDIILVILSYFVALIFRLNDPFPIEWFIKSLEAIILMLTSTIFFTLILRVHLKKLSSFDLKSSKDIFLMVVLVTIITFTGNLYLNLGAPRTTPLIAGSILLILMILQRMSIVNSIQAYKSKNSNQISIAIYGAGSAGTQIAIMLSNSKQYKPVLFVDDNPYLHGLNVSGLRVYKPNKLPEFFNNGKIKEVFVAIPSIKLGLRNEIIQSLINIDCKVQEIPSYEEIIKSGDIVKSLRAVDPEQLLGRDKIQIEMEETGAFYENANVLVSGGGGSIGSELCRKIMKIRPRRLVILEMSELALYTIEKELKPLAVEYGIELVPVLGSVCDEALLSEVFKKNKISVVLHAAAYKHVPLVEANIIEGIKNNIFGTKIIAKIAQKYGVKRFTLVSTDKAVRPTSVMGATKRISELALQDLQEKGGNCIFSMVRFGNVLGSSGSVIPLFKKQIEQGGPVTITHKNVTRYFMTIPEAAQLVLLASSFAKGGEVFVLDMGEPIKIIDLAKRMIHLSGFSIRDDKNENGDIEIQIGELRPGEKLYEELLISGNMLETPHPKILSTAEAKLSSDKMDKIYKELLKCINNQNETEAKNIIFDAIKQCDLVVPISPFENSTPV